MRRGLFALLAPPLAVCRYGCAGCCAAPIGVFWIAGVTSLIYSLYGGPTGGPGISVPTLGLGVLLWVIASVWARYTIQGVAQDQDCAEKGNGGRLSTWCRMVQPRLDETDPFDEVKKIQQ